MARPSERGRDDPGSHCVPCRQTGCQVQAPDADVGGVQHVGELAGQAPPMSFIDGIPQMRLIQQLSPSPLT